MCGGFHGKHNLAFDVGELLDLLHHVVITSAVVADGKGPVNSLPLGRNNAHFMIAFSNIDTHDKHCAHLEKNLQTVPMFL